MTATGVPAYLALKAAMALSQGWSEASNVARFASKYVFWLGLELLEVLRHDLGDGGHRLRVVPEVRVLRVGRQPEDVLGDDDLARSALGEAALDGVHEAVVANAVLHDQLGLADDLGHARARLEGVGIGVGVVQDRGDLDVLPADLAEHVGVLVLRADRDDHAGFGWPTRARREGRQATSAERDAPDEGDLARATAMRTGRRRRWKRSEVCHASSVD